MVARRPWYLGNNGPLYPSYSVDKTRFSSIRWTCDHHSHPVFQRLDPGPFQPCTQLRGKRSAFARERRIGSEFILIVIDRQFSLRGETEQSRLPLIDLFLEPAFSECECGLALALSLRLDEIGKPFGFGKVNPAILKGASGELARFRSPQTFE